MAEPALQLPTQPAEFVLRDISVQQLREIALVLVHNFDVTNTDPEWPIHAQNYFSESPADADGRLWARRSNPEASLLSELGLRDVEYVIGLLYNHLTTYLTRNGEDSSQIRRAVQATISGDLFQQTSRYLVPLTDPYLDRVTRATNLSKTTTTIAVFWLVIDGVYQWLTQTNPNSEQLQSDSDQPQAEQQQIDEYALRGVANFLSQSQVAPSSGVIETQASGSSSDQPSSTKPTTVVNPPPQPPSPPTPAPTETPTNTPGPTNIRAFGLQVAQLKSVVMFAYLGRLGFELSDLPPDLQLSLDTLITTHVTNTIHEGSLAGFSNTQLRLETLKRLQRDWLFLSLIQDGYQARLIQLYESNQTEQAEALNEQLIQWGNSLYSNSAQSRFLDTLNTTVIQNRIDQELPNLDTQLTEAKQEIQRLDSLIKIRGNQVDLSQFWQTLNTSTSGIQTIDDRSIDPRAIDTAIVAQLNRFILTKASANLVLAMTPYEFEQWFELRASQEVINDLKPALLKLWETLLGRYQFQFGIDLTSGIAAYSPQKAAQEQGALATDNLVKPTTYSAQATAFALRVKTAEKKVKDHNPNTELPDTVYVMSLSSESYRQFSREILGQAIKYEILESLRAQIIQEYKVYFAQQAAEQSIAQQIERQLVAKQIQQRLLELSQQQALAAVLTNHLYSLQAHQDLVIPQGYGKYVSESSLSQMRRGVGTVLKRANQARKLGRRYKQFQTWRRALKKARQVRRAQQVATQAAKSVAKRGVWPLLVALFNALMSLLAALAKLVLGAVAAIGSAIAALVGGPALLVAGLAAVGAGLLAAGWKVVEAVGNLLNAGTSTQAAPEVSGQGSVTSQQTAVGQPASSAPAVTPVATQIGVAGAGTVTAVAAVTILTLGAYQQPLETISNNQVSPYVSIEKTVRFSPAADTENPDFSQPIVAVYQVRISPKDEFIIKINPESLRDEMRINPNNGEFESEYNRDRGDTPLDGRVLTREQLTAGQGTTPIPDDNLTDQTREVCNGAAHEGIDFNRFDTEAGNDYWILDPRSVDNTITFVYCELFTQDYNHSSAINTFNLDLTWQNVNDPTNSGSADAVTSHSICWGECPSGGGCWPTTGTVSQLPYGSFSHNSGNGLDAFDVIGREGEPIYASHTGAACLFTNNNTNTLASSSGPSNQNYGISMLIYSDNVVFPESDFGSADIVLLYAHLLAGSTPANLPSCTADQAQYLQVAAGEQIGQIGNNGFSTDPHLHYELRFQTGFEQLQRRGNSNLALLVPEGAFITPSTPVTASCQNGGI